MRVFVVVPAMQILADMTGGFFMPKPAPEPNPALVDASCRVFQEDQEAARHVNALVILERQARKAKREQEAA